MRRALLEILACPVCKGPLELRAEEEQGDEVVTGSLRCPRCDASYPVVETIPRLLPPQAGDSPRQPEQD
ncbi:MAG: methytransferase partner Trm112 [Chloroflexi bacterium]|nr:methytransferase partner Trm112 [Chloroflexota bacterium]